ncbi:MAG TPA: hypothetical protein DCZ94_13285 [Lentisphaeria bacterium]|nr:MAG: hypothetical protein A2X48_24415 [Lentisphaerae bacterium GWF2_49_21]HBC87921.1 hypothetical protein [Lentisphaeria bacterium]
MKYYRITFIGFLFAILLGVAGCASVCPDTVAVLRNNDLSVHVYLPDAVNGYYRSTRFDWSGMVSQVEYKGHTFFEELKKPHNPLVHDHAPGLASEFGMNLPLGFNEAKPGETFIKIGVGQLIKTEKEEYSFGTPFRISKIFPWEIRQEKDSISFQQKVQEEGGWGYEYEKKITLKENSLVVTHRLKNTGTRIIETDFYCHNMILIDKKTFGPGYKIEFPFAVDAPQIDKMKSHGAVINGMEMTFNELKGTLWCQFKGPFSPELNNVKISASGASIEVNADWQPYKFNFYAEKNAVCPEPFLSISLKSGEEKSWNTIYLFSVNEEK